MLVVNIKVNAIAEILVMINMDQEKIVMPAIPITLEATEVASILSTRT